MGASCTFREFLREPLRFQLRNSKQAGDSNYFMMGECWISLEERMACGIGACLGCVCKSVKKDAHTHVNNKRICTEGPVFRAEEVDI